MRYHFLNKSAQPSRNLDLKQTLQLDSWAWIANAYQKVTLALKPFTDFKEDLFKSSSNFSVLSDRVVSSLKREIFIALSFSYMSIKAVSSAFHQTTVCPSKFNEINDWRSSSFDSFLLDSQHLSIFFIRITTGFKEPIWWMNEPNILTEDLVFSSVL